MASVLCAWTRDKWTRDKSWRWRSEQSSKAPANKRHARRLSRGTDAGLTFAYPELGTRSVITG
jgi:hypothetical protein